MGHVSATTCADAAATREALAPLREPGALSDEALRTSTDYFAAMSDDDMRREFGAGNSLIAALRELQVVVHGARV